MGRVKYNLQDANLKKQMTIASPSEELESQAIRMFTGIFLISTLSAKFLTDRSDLRSAMIYTHSFRFPKERPSPNKLFATKEKRFLKDLPYLIIS